MKKILLFFAIVSVAGMLASCNGNGKTAANENEEVSTDVVVEEQTTGSLAGHDWVDLGLPSGTKWATCNVGASKPEEYGNYFAWGETKTKEIFNRETYRYFDAGLTKYTYDDKLEILEETDDAASANWGKDWRIPTEEEFKELLDKCTWTKKANGYEVKGTNGKTIFLPAAGYFKESDLISGDPSKITYGSYWTRSLSLEQNLYMAKILIFTMESSSNYREISNLYRNDGLTIRPVVAK